MIVDVHHHFSPVVSEQRVRKAGEHLLQAAAKMNVEIDFEAMVNQALRTWADPTGEHLIASMAESGIDVTCVASWITWTIRRSPRR